MEGGSRGEMGSNKRFVPPFWAPFFPNNWSDLGWGMGGRRGEVAHGGRGRGGRWGGGTRELPFKNPTTGLIWAGDTRVGGWGEAWGGGPWRAVKVGGDWGGHQRGEQQKVHFFFFFWGWRP